MKKRENKAIIYLFLRYFFLILIALPNLFLFYFVFTPLTIYALYALSSLFTEVSVYGNVLVFSSFSIEIISACVAGSAYYLLLVLNLSIPKIRLKERLKMILFAFACLFIFNILRISALILTIPLGYTLFETLHKFFWYFMNVLIVVGIWFLEVRIFKIKSIPVYTDLKYLYKKSSLTKRKS